MGLVARELEERGIATVCLSMLEEVTRKVKPPRTLLVPFGWGQPLGPPGAADVHRRVARSALALLGGESETPIVRSFEP